MSIQEQNTLHHVCELERRQPLTILAMFIRKSQLAGCLLTGNRSNFFHIESSTAWYTTIPKYFHLCMKLMIIWIGYQCTITRLKYIDPITRQNFKYLTPVTCDNNHQNVIALDLDTDEYYVLTSKPVLRSTPMLLEPKQIQSAISPITFTAQEAGMYSNDKLTNFWNRVSFTKQSDTTPKFLGKAISSDFLVTFEQHQTAFCSPLSRNRFYHYNVLSVALPDHLSNIAPLFASDWSTDALIALIGFPCYVFTEC